MQKVHKVFLMTMFVVLTLILANVADVKGADDFFISKAESAPSVQNKYTKLKVGYVVNTGFMSEDRPGHTVGYGYDYMEFLENYIPCEFEYIVFDDWTDLLDKLNSGEVDIIPNLPGDHKWLVNARSTEHVVGRFPMELVIRPDEIKPQVNLARVRTN